VPPVGSHGDASDWRACHRHRRRQYTHPTPSASYTATRSRPKRRSTVPRKAVLSLGQCAPQRALSNINRSSRCREIRPYCSIGMIGTFAIVDRGRSSARFSYVFSLFFLVRSLEPKMARFCRDSTYLCRCSAAILPPMAEKGNRCIPACHSVAILPRFCRYSATVLSR